MVVFYFWSPIGYCMWSSKTVLRCSHIFNQLSISMISSILTLDLILGLFLTFWGSNGLFLGSDQGSKKNFCVYSWSRTTFILYVSVYSHICFYLILGLFLTFWGPNGLFLGSVWGLKSILGSTHVFEQLLFSIIPSFLSFDFD